MIIIMKDNIVKRIFSPSLDLLKKKREKGLSQARLGKNVFLLLLK